MKNYQLALFCNKITNLTVFKDYNLLHLSNKILNISNFKTPKSNQISLFKKLFRNKIYTNHKFCQNSHTFKNKSNNFSSQNKFKELKVLMFNNNK